MLQIKVNNNLDFLIEKAGEQLFVNNNLVMPDISLLGANKWSIINKLKSYTAEVVSFDREKKIAVIKVNGVIYELTAKDQFDLLLDKMGLGNAGSALISDIKAPMPGLVLKLFAEKGMTVKKGENLFILEAMKMENIIKSPVDAVIKAVSVKQGDKVEKGQVMLHL